MAEPGKRIGELESIECPAGQVELIEQVAEPVKRMGEWE